MTVTAPVFDKSEAKIEKTYPYHLPTSEEWSEQKDIFGSGTMMLAGGGMFMRNPLIIWTSMVLAVQQFVTQEPLRRHPDSNSPLALLGMAVSGVIATSLPKILIGPQPTTASVLDAAISASASASSTTSA